MAQERSAAHSDLAMIQGVRAGDEVAMGQFVTRMRCVPRILSALNARRGRPLNPHDLADTVQDVLVVVWHKLDTYEGRASLESWVYSLCHLELMNAIRRKSRAPGELDLHGPDVLVTRVAADTPWDAEEVQRGIEWLGEPGASVVRLKHFEGLTFDEIAHRLGTSPNTVKTRYYRSLEALHTHLKARRGGRARERTRS